MWRKCQISPYVMHRNLKFLHMTNLFSTNIFVGFVTNMRYATVETCQPKGFGLCITWLPPTNRWIGANISIFLSKYFNVSEQIFLRKFVNISEQIFQCFSADISMFLIIITIYSWQVLGTHGYV